MYDFWLQQAIDDYLFHEVQENIDAFVEYINCLEAGDIPEGLEEHIFSRLDIYLENCLPLFEVILSELTAASDDYPRSYSADDYDESYKDTLLTAKHKKLADANKRRIEAHKSGEEKKKEKAKENRKETVKEFEKRTKGKGPIRTLKRKLGITSLRKTIKDKAKTALKKLKPVQDLKEKLKKGLSAGGKRIDAARRLFNRYAKQYEQARARGQEYQKIRSKMLRARAKYNSLRSSKLRHGKRYVYKKIR